MENKKLIMIFGAGFSIVFSILYYILFTSLPARSNTDSIDAKTLYYNQVGLYRQQDSMESMKNTLKEKGFDAYTMKQGDITAVISGISFDGQSTKDEQPKLKEAGFAFVEKEITIDDPQVLELFDQKAYDAALERMTP